MPTIKLVVIGASGVGKTSLRSQYISGRFSNGYRATIGADFITKTLPHPTNPAETVTLQIWDTAGQERFSSLSTAFFRGADAALLMFDVNSAETMQALTKWWAEFKQSAPLKDEDIQDFCCCVVGNKTDLMNTPSRMNGLAIGAEGDGAVTAEEASKFLQELVPPRSRSPSPVYEGDTDASATAADTLSESHATIRPNVTVEIPSPNTQTPSPKTPSPDPIDIPPTSNGKLKSPKPQANGSVEPSPSASTSSSPRHRLTKSRSRSSNRFYMGTATTTATSTLSIYHTPSSSFFDQYHSARSTPDLPSSSSRTGSGRLNHRPSSSSLSSLVSSFEDDEPFLSLPPSINGSTRSRRMTGASMGSASSGSAATITPSLFARESVPAQQSKTVVITPTNEQPHSTSFRSSLSPHLDATQAHPDPPILPPPQDTGPKLFFTSAKTGEGVKEVFKYIAKRVIRRWEFEERREARRMYIRERDASASETIRLGHRGRDGRGWSGGAADGQWPWMGRAGRGECCSN